MAKKGWVIIYSDHDGDVHLEGDRVFRTEAEAVKYAAEECRNVWWEWFEQGYDDPPAGDDQQDFEGWMDRARWSRAIQEVEVFSDTLFDIPTGEMEEV